MTLPDPISGHEVRAESIADGYQALQAGMKDYKGKPFMRVAAILLAATALADPAHAADLALKRVMLSSAGVGYFEYEATVDGPATLGLDFQLDQVDDVLKSLVVFDDAGGVGGIELRGRDETHAAFGDVPFGPDGLTSPLAFLNSLQGVEVIVAGPRPMTGRILHAESVYDALAQPNAPASARTRVSVLTTEGLKQFVLEDSDAVQVADPALRDRIARALTAARHESAQDTRHVTIHATGPGQRVVRVSYVAVAPLWKASYRLMLPAAGGDPAAKARLQGWATLENATGTAWSGVALSVQYGNPVTFHQSIYRSYFVTRPEVPVEVLGRLLPDVDSRAHPAVAAPPPPSPATPAAIDRAAPLMVQKAQAPAGGMAPPAEAASVAEAAEETVFTVSSPVTLAAGHSASVPILDSEFPASRIGLVTEDQSHPLAAIRLVNASGSSLPAGVLTLYDITADAPYAGDARLGGVPAGESRLIAYAQDLRTTAEWQRDEEVTVAGLTAASGTLTVDERTRSLVHVTLVGPALESRHVLLELPKLSGGMIADAFPKPSEETTYAWRFGVDLRPGEIKRLTIAIDRNDRQMIAILDDEDAVAAVLDLRGTTDVARAALKSIAGLRAQESARTADRDALATQQEAVDTDEQRVRSNLAVVSGGDAIRTRLLRQLDADETRHAQLANAVNAANAAIIAAHTALVNAVSTLRL